MRRAALRACLAAAGARAAAAQEAPLLAAWLQHQLACSSVVAGIATSSAPSAAEQQPARRQRGRQQQQQQQAQAQQQAPQQQAQQQQEVPLWRSAIRDRFSVRPSVLSPLHVLHRETEETERRLSLLRSTITAHMKLSEELHPSELEAHAGSPDPVEAALDARRAALQAAKDAYDALCLDYVPPCGARREMQGYYGVLEAALGMKDRDAAQFQAVLDGERSVWDYWFSHFAPQYAGLPDLGSIEALYNQPDEEVLLRDQVAQLRAPAPKPPPQPEVDHLGRAAAAGGRKTSTATVCLWRGSGRLLVNGQQLDAYFGDLLMRSHVLRPLATTGLVGRIDAAITVRGGGVSGQAQAAAHGIAKALRKLDPALRAPLRAAGLLRRDPRAVERKKFGKAKARKGFAWVKR